MKFELHGYSTEIEIYKESMGYQLGGIQFCRNMSDIEELKRYQEFFDQVMDKLIELREEKPKQKIKYYPVLFKCLIENKFLVSNGKYKSKEDFHSRSSNKEFIRLITEIPELIEEHDE